MKINPFLVLAVPLLERHQNILKVKGLEAVDGSPVIDIKPYSASYFGWKSSNGSGSFARSLHGKEISMT
ncbi:MAG: TrmO family methyltransferase [Desulfotignum sp.]